MTQTTILTVLAFVVIDALRMIFIRSAFLGGAETWSFILSTVIVSIIFFSFTYGIKYRRDLIELFTKKRKALLIVLAINAWHFGLAGTLYVVSTKYLQAPVVSMLIQSIILFSAVWERLFFKESQSKSFWLLLLGNVIGLSLIAVEKTTGNDSSISDFSFNVYYLIPLAAAFCFSITDNFSRHYLRNELVKPELMAFFRPIGFLVFIPILLIVDLFGVLKLDFSGLFNPNILFQIIAAGVSMSLAWVLLNRSYKLTSVTNLCMISMLKPIIVLIISTIFLNEYFNLIQSIGAGIIILSSFLFIYLKKQ